MNNRVKRALTHTGPRYQVLTERGKHGTSARTEDFETKAEANRRIKELAAQGITATLWDTQDNALSALFSI